MCTSESYPVNFCHYSSVFTLWYLLSKDSEFFSGYSIRKLHVYEESYQFYTPHWLIVQKDDGKIGKIKKPVIDMTIHQFGKSLKPGIVYEYPLDCKMVLDKSDHTRTLIRILRNQNKEAPKDLYDSIKLFCSNLNSHYSPFVK